MQPVNVWPPTTTNISYTCFQGETNDPANREKHIEDVVEQFEAEDILLRFGIFQRYCESQRQGVDVNEEIVYLYG